MFEKLRARARGAHVPHRKGTAGKATQVMPVPKTITLVVQQHIGAPSQPVVKKGDRVEVGTVVAQAGGFVGAPIHSGVSGVVTAIEPVLTSAGTLVEGITIEADGLQTVSPEVEPPLVHNRETFLEAVRTSGLVGLGGAGFPTAVKLAPKNLDSIDTLIINAAECEPYITSDDREMLENGETILRGIAACLKYLGIPRAVIAVERNKPEAMDLMFSLTEGEATMEVLPLDSKYPQGAEKVLIQTVTGREVPAAGGLPADVGVIVLNVTTVSTIGKYLATGMPLVARKLTVAGAAVAVPQNVEVIIGTPVADIMEFCGGYTEPPAKLLMGGPMMGVALPSDAHPTMKQNNAILALTKHEAALPDYTPCIRCSRCIGACPVSLSPIETAEAYEKRDFDRLEKLNASVCIACGVCSFVCPAKRPLSNWTTLARDYYVKEAKKR